MSQKHEKLKNLLKELFQLDQPDLDFGLYRIMHAKSAEITQFLDSDLLPRVKEALAQYKSADRAEIEKELSKATEQARELGVDPETTQKVLELRERLQNEAVDIGALEAEVYDHLYGFFRRYYSEGDFLSKRVYKPGVYAIPYEGEEVKLHWANADQYYIKTSEYLRDYAFRLHPDSETNPMRVHFRLVDAAEGEHGNVKETQGKERRFSLSEENTLSMENGELVIRFTYQPDPAKQKELNTATETTLLNTKDPTLPDWIRELGKPHHRADGSEAGTRLRVHLDRYTARNTFDYFIHKDLGGFLRRELDFYIKNEVMHLDDVDNKTVEKFGQQLLRLEQQLSKIKVIRRIAGAIIDFLAQLEDFQKKLWLKKKIVVETSWCIRLGIIPEVFYAEIAANESQREEWIKLETAGTAGVPPATTGKITAGKITTGPAGLFDEVETSTPEPTDPASPREHMGWHSRGYLPHLDAAGLTQFITFRLHDSVPAKQIETWKNELHWIEGLAADSKQAIELRKRVEKYEDAGKGACFLRDARVAEMVENALCKFDGERYRLIEWCVMPNHVHVLIEQLPGHLLSDVMHSWKSFTAHEANKILGRKGEFWMQEYFDRFIRNEKHFRAVVEYIRENPVKGGLAGKAEDWRWSSAWREAAGMKGRDSVESGGRDSAQSNGGQEGELIAAGRDGVLPAAGWGGVSGDAGRDARFPSLLVDTRHFPREFTDRLLEALGDIDEQTDGVLFHSENFQALALMQSRFRAKVGCIYIDPPYNSDASAIDYKNGYKSSSWIALINDRISTSQTTLIDNGVLVSAIDDEQHRELSYVLSSRFSNNLLGTICIRSNPSGRPTKTGYSVSHEYLLFAGASSSSQIGRLPPTNEQLARFGEKDVKGSFEWRNLRREGSNSDRSARPALYYPIYISGSCIRVPEMTWDTANKIWKISQLQQLDEEVVWPDNEDGIQKTWRWEWKTVVNSMSELAVRKDRSGRNYPYYKRRPHNEGVVSVSSWFDAKYSATEHGTAVLKQMFGETLFSYPKSIHAVHDALYVANGFQRNAIILDFFAGSGTTGHATINLNREDGGCRKFILVEMADYFDTVLLPRLKKVTFTPEWKDGKPTRLATAEEVERSPRIMKVLRLESYEDTLNNLDIRRTKTQEELLFSPQAQGEDGLREQYMLRYMLDVETRGSQSLLNVSAFADPTAYKLKVRRPGSDENRVVNVDLQETFNWLIGLTVKHIAAPMAFSAAFERDSEKRLRLKGRLKEDPEGSFRFRTVSGVLPDGRNALVIWRKLTGNPEEDNLVLDEWFTKQGYSSKDSEFDLIYVNGGNNLENLKAPDDTWKVRLIEEDFHRLMFEEEGI